MLCHFFPTFSEISEDNGKDQINSQITFFSLLIIHEFQFVFTVLEHIHPYTYMQILDFILKLQLFLQEIKKNSFLRKLPIHILFF